MLIESNNIIHVKKDEDLLTKVCELSQSFNARIYLSKSAYENLTINSLIFKEINNSKATSIIMKCSSKSCHATFVVSIKEGDSISVDKIIKDGYNAFCFSLNEWKKSKNKTTFYVVA